MTKNFVYLADGREVQAEVEQSYDRGTVSFEGRTFTVERLPPPYHYRGYGEVVHIRLRTGRVLGAVLHPHEYEHHRATVPIGAIETAQARQQYPGDIITESKSSAIVVVYDQVAKQWREMIDEEKK